MFVCLFFFQFLRNGAEQNGRLPPCPGHRSQRRGERPGEIGEMKKNGRGVGFPPNRAKRGRPRGMNRFSRKPAHAMPNWQAPASTEKPAGHRGAARWRVPGVKPGSGSPPEGGGGAGLSCPVSPFGGGSGGGGEAAGSAFFSGGGLASSALRCCGAPVVLSLLPRCSAAHIAYAGRGRFIVGRPRVLGSRLSVGVGS